MSKSIKTSNSNKNVPSKSKVISKTEVKKDLETKTVKTSKTSKTDPLKKSTTKNEEKEVRTTVTTKGPISKASKITSTTKTTTDVKIRPKISLQKQKTEIKSQPLRAKHTVDIVNRLKTTQNHSVNKSNVMNSIHNVTVLSPPPKRKQTTIENASTTAPSPVTIAERKPNKTTKTEKGDSRQRTRTRTLDPDEVLVLKKTTLNAKTNAKSEQKVDTVLGEKVNNKKGTDTTDNNKQNFKPITKEAIAYEINFDNEKNKEKTEPKYTEKKRSESISKPGPSKSTKQIEKKVESDSDNYEDDFESYESDFETGTSSAEASDSAETPLSEDEDSGSSTETENNQSKNGKNSESEAVDTEDYDDSEETQPPITVIHKEKDDERKLDSGNYDMNSRREKQIQQVHQQQLDSIDTITGNSEQLDSGISYHGNTITLLSTPSPSKSTSAASFSFYTSGTFNPLGVENSSKFSKRGEDLMKKIQLDEITYTLLDLKPISYENYMKMYGNVNTIQTATQTNEDRMSAYTQTNECQLRSIWTQHPPQYDLNFIQNRNLRNLQNSCGDFEDDENYYLDNNKENSPSSPDVYLNNETLMRSLKELQRFRRNELKRVQEIQKPINFDRLNEFLNQNVFTISGILNRANQNKKIQNPTDMNKISKGYFILNMNFINALKVVKIFANTNSNLILTVHESVEGVYRSEFLNLISVWTISESEKPIRLLSTWSEVCRADICSENSDIIVCGLRDGSIAMWDLRETYSFCSKLDGYLRHFPATQAIAPILNANDTKLIDLGAVVDIKSFRKSDRICDLKTYKPVQMVSLNDTGILTIWTLIETNSSSPFSSGFTTTIPNQQNKKRKQIKIEYNSPWARVKLIQSEIVDLREYLDLKNIRPKSGFEKTKSYFENDLFNDDALRELQETQNDVKLGLQGLRFTNLDTGIERIFIGTNRNFIIACTKTLRIDQFHKIIFDETKFLFPTIFRLLKSEEFLVVGLSNGSVMSVNCNLNKLYKNNKQLDEFKQRPPSSSKMKDDFEFDNESGKSCAIQNIVRNERKTYENSIASKSDSRESSSDEMNLMKIFDDEDYFHIFDQQILLDGSILRKGLVQNIEISSDGEKMIVLTDAKLRVFDFKIGKEITDADCGNSIQGLAMARNVSSHQNLIVVIKNDEVQVHSIK